MERFPSLDAEHSEPATMRVSTRALGRVFDRAQLAQTPAVNEIIPSLHPKMMLRLFLRVALAIALLVSLPSMVAGQAPAVTKTTPVVFDADSARLAELPWRSIGPAVTSGRVVDFAVPEGPKSQVGARL